MKILVTGATGFLGGALSARLAEEDHDLILLNSRNCDLRRPDSLDRFGDTAYDVIYHLAVWTQAGDFCLHHPGEQWVINQQINTNVLAWWQRCQPQAKLVCMGTSCAYDPDRELVEDNYLDGVPHPSLLAYGMTKRMLYVGLVSLAQQYGLNYLHLIPSTLYGPGYHTDERQLHFIFDLVRKIVRGHLYDEPVVLWGDGYQRRELVLLDDFVGIMRQLTDTCDRDLVNIGAGEDYTIREFAQIICDEVGYDFGRIRFDTSRYVGARAKKLVITKLDGLLPNVDFTPLKTGLSETVRWYMTHACG